MAYSYLRGDIEINLVSGVASVVDVYVNARALNIIFDIINEGGASVYFLACNAPKTLVDDGYVIPDAEMEASPASPITASVFNQNIVAPNFIRLKSDGVGEVKFRARANGFGQ